MNVHIPNHIDIYMIAFLVKHGWVLDVYNNREAIWTKEGEKKTLTYEQERENRRFGSLVHNPDEFTTDEAFSLEFATQEMKKL